MQDEQASRFDSRRTGPLKQWKVSSVDLASLDECGACTQTKEMMFFCTGTVGASWTDDKKRVRIAALQRFLSHLPYPD